MNTAIARQAIEFLKISVTLMDVVFFVVLVGFVRKFRWGKEKDRPAIVGFMMMIVAVVLSVVCMWI